MLKLGIIGMSEGNGHPYSWSAIINGDFNRKEMDKCGYAGIPIYLEANRDTLGIDDVRVTHVWTQDRKISEHIAKASMIERVVDKADEMICDIDAVLLARDDPENHVFLSGTQVREMLERGEMLPAEFTRPEVSKVLIEGMRRRNIDNTDK